MILAVSLFISGCGASIAVRSKGIAPSFLYTPSKEYTLIMPDKSSLEYLVFMESIPYIMYGLKLNGYEFKGFNNFDWEVAPILITISFFTFDKKTVFSATNWGFGAVTGSIWHSEQQVIAISAFNSETKEALWTTSLTGRGGLIQDEKLFEIPAIMYLGYNYISKRGEYTAKDYPEIHFDKYIDFMENAEKYFYSNTGYKVKPIYHKRNTDTDNDIINNTINTTRRRR
jgi:hypothetical protein